MTLNQEQRERQDLTCPKQLELKFGTSTLSIIHGRRLVSYMLSPARNTSDELLGPYRTSLAWSDTGAVPA